ncbi:MAG: hypothetical protein RLZ51_1862 [Pseudomonadota bacterium]|jgi:hypothetical protein
MAKWKELGDSMKVELEVSVALVGGSVLVTVADETQGVKLTRLATELIESREGRFGMIGEEDIDALAQVGHELWLASDLLSKRVVLERERRRARGEAL